MSSDSAGPWRVFLSHTSELRNFPDLQRSYVTAVENAIIAAGHAIEVMRNFAASGESPRQVCIRKVKKCDVYVAVLGLRHGSPVRDMPEKSYTELEFDTATEAGLERLVFLLDDTAKDVGIPAAELRDESWPRQRAFRERVKKSGLTIQTFTNAAELGQLVERSLRELADLQDSRGQLHAGPPQGTGPVDGGDHRPSIMVSYITADGTWAEWLREVLDGAGYNAVQQSWHFVTGENWSHRADVACDSNDCVILLISSAFTSSPYSNVEWTKQLTRRVTEPGRAQILAVRIESATLPAALKHHPVVDISTVGSADAVSLIVEQLSSQGFAPRVRPHDVVLPRYFPGQGPRRSDIRPRNSNFTGRTRVFKELQGHLLPPPGRPKLAACALHGIAGVGKTQIAIEFAHRFGSHYHLVWWVAAENSVSIASDLVNLARELGVSADAEQQQTLRDLWIKLRDHEPWLLIFDNAERRSILENFWPPNSSGSVLITSQSTAWQGLATVITVREFGPKAATTFLQKRATVFEEPVAASNVAQKLGYSPLALEQAAAYVEESGTTAAEYSTRVLDQLNTALAQGTPSWYRKTTAVAWKASLARAYEKHPKSRHLLGVLAFLSPDGVPRDLLLAGARAAGESTSPASGDAMEYDSALAALITLSLVTVEDDHIVVHRLFQRFTRGELNPTERRDYQLRAIEILAAAFPSDFTDTKSWATCDGLLPHVLMATDSLDKDAGLKSGAPGRILQAAGEYLHYCRGDYAETRKVLPTRVERSSGWGRSSRGGRNAGQPRASLLPPGQPGEGEEVHRSGRGDLASELG